MEIEAAALAETVESAPAASEVEESKPVENTEQQSTEEASQEPNTEDSTPSESDGEKTGETSGDDAPAEQPKKKGVQKRIDELTAKRKEIERERDYYKQLAEQQTVKEPAITYEPIEPSVDEFRDEYGDVDHEKFADAMREFATQKAEWIEHQKTVETSKRQKQIESQKRTWKYQDACSEFAKTQTDFWQVSQNPDLPITSEMGQVIVESEIGPEVAYYLGKNPDLATQISQLPAHKQYMEMGKLENEISSKKMPVNTISKAPAPIKPVGNKSNVERSMADMDYDEFVKAREKQVAARRGR